MEENDGVSGPEIIVHGPSDGEGTLVAEIDGDADLAVGPSGGGPSAGRKARR